MKGAPMHDDPLVRGLSRVEVSHHEAQRRWRRRRNRRAMWQVLGWVAFFIACFVLIVLWAAVTGPS